MGFESLAISARVTKQMVTIFSKTCDNLYISAAFLSDMRQSEDDIFKPIYHVRISKQMK